MGLEIRQVMAMCCTECGRPIGMAEGTCASDLEIAEEFAGASNVTVEEQGVKANICPKCGQRFAEDHDSSL